MPLERWRRAIRPYQHTPRVLILGTTNNSLTLLAEGIRAVGCHVTLVVLRKEDLHRPEAFRKKYATRLPDWIIDLSNGTDLDFGRDSPRGGEMVKLALAHDIVIANDLAIALIPTIAARVPTVAWLTGSDLTFWANPATATSMTEGWSNSFRRSSAGRDEFDRIATLIEAQREGIRSAAALHGATAGVDPAGDRLLEDISPTGQRLTTIYYADVEGIAPSPPRDPKSAPVTSMARVDFISKAWQSPLDGKGTDTLLAGFAEFVRYVDPKARLVLPRKGLDLEACDDFIGDKRLAPNVVWVPEVPRHSYLEYLAAASGVFDSVGPSTAAHVTFDSLCSARPCFANVERLLESDQLAGLPVRHCASVRGVTESLIWLFGLPDEARDAGLAGRKFAEERLRPSTAARLILKQMPEIAPLLRDCPDGA